MTDAKVSLSEWFQNLHVQDDGPSYPIDEALLVCHVVMLAGLLVLKLRHVVEMTVCCHVGEGSGAEIVPFFSCHDCHGFSEPWQAHCSEWLH